MARRWHQSVGVRAALVAGCFGLAAVLLAFGTTIVAGLRSPARVHLLQFTLNPGESLFQLDTSARNAPVKHFTLSDDGSVATHALSLEEEYVARGMRRESALAKIRKDLRRNSFGIANKRRFDQILDLLERGPSVRDKEVLAKLNPVFDVSLENRGGKAAVLTALRVMVHAADYQYGSTEERAIAKALEVVGRYNIQLEPIATFEKVDGFGDDPAAAAKISPRRHDLLPPVVIPPGAAARVQVQLQSPNELASWYELDLEFLFSSGAAVKTERVRVSW